MTKDSVKNRLRVPNLPGQEICCKGTILITQ